jgi:hypothetical protein
MVFHLTVKLLTGHQHVIGLIVHLALSQVNAGLIVVLIQGIWRQLESALIAQILPHLLTRKSQWTLDIIYQGSMRSMEIAKLQHVYLAMPATSTLDVPQGE